MKVCTVNVTRLTKARLKDVFSAEPCEGVDIILIQESRHETLSPGWVTRLAENHGFGVACSQVLAKDSVGRRVSIHRASDHRSVAIKTRDTTFASTYGPAQHTDGKWFDNTQLWLSEVAGENGPIVWCGDFNWRKFYDRFVVGDWSLAEQTMATTGADTQPTRCVTRSSRAKQTDVTGSATIPHHRLVLYEVEVEVHRKQTT